MSNHNDEITFEQLIEERDAYWKDIQQVAAAYTFESLSEELKAAAEDVNLQDVFGGR